MKFKDWFDSKLIVIENKEEISKLKYHHILCDIDILKKLYNAYKHTGILDLPEIYIFKTKDDNNYRFGVNDKYLQVDSLFDYISNMTGYKIMEELDKDNLRKIFMFSFEKPRQQLQFDDEYYFLLTVNPDHYNLNYIERIEDLIGPHINQYNSVSGLLDEFIELMKSDNSIRYIISTIWQDFGIIGFKSEEDLYTYIKERTFNEVASDAVKISLTEDDMQNIIKNLKTNSTIISSILPDKSDNNGSLLN